MNSRKKETVLVSAHQQEKQVVPTGIYRKLMWQAHKRVENNIDIAPQISMALMFAFILCLVSLWGSDRIQFTCVINNNLLPHVYCNRIGYVYARGRYAESLVFISAVQNLQ